MLRVRVSTASAEIIETELITAGRRGLECGFEFNSAWDGLAKTVIVNGVVKRDIVLVSDTITVPGECLAREQFPLRIGVYGANGAGEIVIPTIWANFGKILPSARPSGIDPDEVTPDVVAQIQTNSSDALRLAQEVMRRADSGEFDGRDGATGPSGPAGPKGGKGDKGDKGDAFVYADFTPQQLAALTGPQGPQGEQGPQGVKGDKGDKGDTGDTGPTGPQGPKGDKGDKGDPGQNGTATDAQVAAWLDEHPEATTTVQDGSITKAKLTDGLIDELQDFDEKRVMIPAGTTIAFPGNGWYMPNPIFNQGNGHYNIYLYDENGDGITITRDSDSVVVGTGSWRYAFNADVNLNYFKIEGTALEHYGITNAKYNELYSIGRHTKTTYTLSAAPKTIGFSKQMAFNAIATVSIPQFDKEITDEQVLGHLVDYVDENSALSNVFSHSPAVLTLRDAGTVTQAPDGFKKYKALDGLYFHNPTTSATTPHRVVFYDTDGNIMFPPENTYYYDIRSAWVEFQERRTFEIKDGKIRAFEWFAHGAIPSVPLPSYITASEWIEFPRPLGYISMDGTYNCVYTDAAHEDTGEQFVAIDTEKNFGLLEQINDEVTASEMASLDARDEYARRFRTEVVRENNRTRHAFRIGSFNVARYGQAHWYRIKECLQNYGIDICGLQEVTYPLGDDPAVSNPYTKKLSEEFLSWQFNSFSTNGASGDFPNSTSHNYATNVRSMMAGNGFEVDTSVEYQFQSQGGSNWDWRYVEKCELSIPRYKDKRGSENLKLSIYNTQLELSKSYNLAQAQEILAMVQNDPNPFIIIMGDTNDFTLGKETWAIFEEAGFTPVINTNTSTVAGTEDFNCIDNFFVSSRISALDWNVVWAQDWPWKSGGGVQPMLSDHDLVYADLALDYSDIRCVNLFLTNCTTTWTRGWLSDSETVTITITPDDGYQLPAQPNKMLDCMIANPEALSYSNGTVTIDGSKLIGDVYIKIAATATT